MEEVFPLVAGVAIGMAIHGAGPVWLRVAVVGVLGLAFGILASWISGELAMIPGLPRDDHPGAKGQRITSSARRRNAAGS